MLGWGSHPGCGWEALLGSLLEGKHRQKSSFPESNRRFNYDKCTNVSETNKYLNDHIIKYHYNSKSERGVQVRDVGGVVVRSEGEAKLRVEHAL